MSSTKDNVVPFAAPSGSGGSNGGGNHGERLAALENQMRHMATKEDIQKIKVWVLGGVLGGVFGGVSLALAVMRFFPPAS